MNGIDIFTDEDGRSLYGLCGYCGITVDNYDPNHRVTPILRGGRGVECVLRRDLLAAYAGPLRSQPSAGPARTAENGEQT